MNRFKLKRKITITSLSATILIFSFSHLHATIYFVSNNGNDNNNGTSTLTAWEKISKVNSISFNPGDSILFEAGGVWRESLYVDAGSTSAKVFYGRFGIGTNPKILGSESASTWITTSTANVWQCTEIFIDPRGNYPSELFFVSNDSTIWGDFQTYDASFTNLSKENDWTFNNSAIFVYSTSNPSSIYDLIEVPQRDGVLRTSSNSASYIEVNGIDMHYSKRWGYYSGYPAAKGATDISFKNLNIGYIGYKGGASSYGITAYHSNFLVDSCTFTDCGRRGISYNIYTAPSSGNERYISNVIIRNSTFKRGQHTTSLDLAAESICNGDTIVDVYFYNNRIDDHELNMTREDKTSNQIYIQQGSAAYFNRIHIYNNVFIQATARNILINSADSVFIWNNTTVGHNPNITTNPYGNIIVTSCIVDYKNNITYDNLLDDSRVNYGLLMEHTNASFIERDCNLYYQENENTSNSNRGFTGGYHGYYSTSEWSSYLTRNPSLDSHSPTPTNPEFVNYDNFDFRLSEASVAISAGTPISMITTDILGNPRDSFFPSIGAYEYTELVPETHTINDQIFNSNANDCFGATQTIIVAENGNPVTFESGSNVNLIAGQSIQLLSGTSINEGAYVHAYLTEDESFCDQLPQSMLRIPATIEKSINIGENKQEFSKVNIRQSLKVYPTINDGIFTLELNGFESNVQVTIYNYLGAKIKCIRIHEKQAKVDISHCQKGLYFINVTSNAKQLNERIIKK